MKTTLKTSITLLAAVAGLLLAAPALRAQTFFTVDLNTAALLGQPNAPFYLDVQLNYGGTGTLSNTASLYNFSYTNGGVITPVSPFGNVSGDFAPGDIANLTTSNATPFNEMFQGFAPTTTNISFNVNLSQNYPGVSPDGLVISILDSESGNPQIGTTAPDGVSLITVPIETNTATTLASINAYTAPTATGFVTAAVATPEPSSWAVALIAASAFGLVRYFRRHTV